MASGSNDDSKQRDRASRGGQPYRRGGATDPRSTSSPGRRPGGEDVDFGAFVSERVRSASERLRGTPPESSSGTERSAEPSAPSAPRDEPTPIRRQRPSRYWRDSLRNSTGEDVEPSEGTSRRYFVTPSQPEGRGPDEPDTGGGGGDGGEWWRRLVPPDDGDGSNRNLIILGVAAVLVLALIIFGLTRLIGDGGGDAPDPVETPAPTVAIPGAPPGASTPEPEEEPDDPSPTETPEIRRGGDNQLTPPNGGDEDAEGSRSPDEYESEVARSCPGECLVRLVGDDVTEVLRETGNRPSFAVDDVAWVVVTPDEAEDLDADAEMSLIADSSQTYNLYLISAGDGPVDPFVSAEHGTVVDSIGRHSLVAFNQVPAPIRSLVDLGYEVHKLAPAPSDVATLSSRPPLSSADAGTLVGAVDSGRLQQTMNDLVSIGELDNSGLGTRYYAYPGNQIAADYLYQELESYGLDVWFEDFISWDGLLLVNVVAEAPGRDDSSTYAIMSHLDSFNGETPRQAPGGDDNSTGMAVNLEVARILSGYELEHPVRFVFANAEEVGIQGATAWARHANANGVNIEGVLNVDSVGSARQGGYVVTNSDESSAWLQDLMTSVNDDHDLGQVIQHLQDPDIVADDNMLRDEGISAIMIARELYGWTPFHHTTEDTLANVSIDSVSSMTYLTLLMTARLAG